MSTNPSNLYSSEAQQVGEARQVKAIDSSSENLLDPFFRPAGIALVGVSRNAQAVTSRPARYLAEWGFSGIVEIVHPAPIEELHGYRTVRSASDLNDACEVALVMVPADKVVEALEECAQAGIRNAVSIASGFEGESGSARRRDVEAFLRSVPDFRLIGPNSAGVMSAAGNSVLSFSSTLLKEEIALGRVGLVMQSGAIGNGLLLTLLRRGAGIAHLVSTGNELDLGALTIASAMLEDRDCSAVGMFLEGITDPEALPVLRDAIATTGKRVICLRGGTSEIGKQAAFGHTGRIIGDNEISSAALEQIGVTLVETIEELSDVLTVLSVLAPHEDSISSPLAQRSSIGIVTVSGGLGVIAADGVARARNLVLAELSEDSRNSIEEDVGVPLAVANPFDVPTLGNPEVFGRAIRAMGKHAGCTVVLALVSTLAHDYELFANGDYEDLPPVVFSHLSPEEGFTPDQARRLAAKGIASVPSPRNAVRAISNWASRSDGQFTGTGDKGPEHLAGGIRLGIIESRKRLGSMLDTWMLPARVASSSSEAVGIANEIGLPVAVKAEGTSLAHRTEAGAVLINLGSAESVASAFADVSAASPAGEGVIVQAMAKEGFEVLLGVIRDPEVGVAAVCRPGGLLAEIGAATVIFTEATRGRWDSLLTDSQLGGLLEGYRGGRVWDSRGFLRLVEDVFASVESDPAISGIECNPILVHGSDQEATSRPASIVDLMMVVNVPSTSRLDKRRRRSQ